MEIRRQQHEKRKTSNDEDSHSSKIATLETKIKNQELQIAALTASKEDSANSVLLPPQPSGNVLKPSPGFTQRKQKE